MAVDNAVSLFAGIGGFDLALERAGIETQAVVELDASCRGVLSRHFPKAMQGKDVRAINGDDLWHYGFNSESGILTAGWPCQGNSVAGRRGGMADPRSALWGSTVRLVAETRPRWFLGENVPGLLTVNNGRDFLAVVSSLDELGYGVAWRVLDAQNFGVPQRRRRVFIVGCLGDGASPAEVLFEPESMCGDSAESGEAQAGDPRAAVVSPLTSSGGAHGFRLDAEMTAGGQLVVSTLQGGGKRGYRIDAEGAAGGHLVPVAFAEAMRELAQELDRGVLAVAFSAAPGQIVGTLDAHDGPHGHGGANVQSAFAGRYIPDMVGVRRLTPRECERLQGFPDDWTVGQSDSARYRQLGNAVAVPCAQWIVNRIVQHERESMSTSNHDDQSPSLKEAA